MKLIINNFGGLRGRPEFVVCDGLPGSSRFGEKKVTCAHGAISQPDQQNPKLKILHEK